MKVIVDRHRHAALLVKQTAKWIHILHATPRGLVAGKLSEDELTGGWSELTQYPIGNVLASFKGIGNTKGATKGALTLLDQAHDIHEEELSAARCPLAMITGSSAAFAKLWLATDTHIHGMTAEQIKRVRQLCGVFYEAGGKRPRHHDYVGHVAAAYQEGHEHA